MRVPLLDLKPQYQSIKKEIDEAIQAVVDSQYFIMGPTVEKMEKQFAEFLGAKYAFGVSSGTDALLLSLMAAGIKAGDEVILPTYSFFATVGVVARLGATPVFTDVDPVSFNVSVEDFKSKITSKTKAVIPVHLYGQSAEMNEIMEIANENDIKVIEDGAQAISTQYKDGRCVGTIGLAGCYSFFPSKNLGGFGDGGLIVTNDDDFAYNVKIMRNHGMDPKYYHNVLGGNFRLDALQAAVLSVKLPYLNQWSEGRRNNAELYTKLFINKYLAESTGRTEFDSNNKVLLPKAVFVPENITDIPNYHIYNQYVIRVENRDELRKFLTENEIFTEVYYPVPFHLQKCFEYLGYKKGDFPISEFAADTSLALPIYPELSEEQIIFVVDKINEFIKTN